MEVVGEHGAEILLPQNSILNKKTANKQTNPKPPQKRIKALKSFRLNYVCIYTHSSGFL